MKRFRNTLLTCLSSWVMLLSIGYAQASEFLNLCQSSLARAETFVAECREKSRPFDRNFIPAGAGAPVSERFAAWFDIASGSSNFGLGCVLGPNGNIIFLGIYFFLQPSNFRLANSAKFTFVDFQGNIGLQPTATAPFTLLAVHKLTPPGREARFPERNCEIGSFDPNENTTKEQVGKGWLRIHKIGAEDPTPITKCSLSESQIHPDQSQCFTRTFKSFVNATKSALIYGEPSIKITESGRVYVDEDLWTKICRNKFRSPIEAVNFVKELCG